MKKTLSWIYGAAILITFVVLSFVIGLFQSVPLTKDEYLRRVFSPENVWTNLWIFLGSAVVVAAWHLIGRVVSPKNNGKDHNDEA